ncbi:MAG: PIN domain-containing protein [Luteolibacter sp.]
MKETVIVDAGPLVAYFDRSERNHEWAKACFARLTEPLVTCEAVIAEALFLLRRGGISPSALLQLITRGLLVPSFSLRDEASQIHSLIERYQNVPMSLADACLVRMAEIHTNPKVMTLDSDFTIYRKSNRRVIPVLSPYF